MLPILIVIAVIEFLWDGRRPYSAMLGRTAGVKGYHDITRYPEARLIRAWCCFVVGSPGEAAFLPTTGAAVSRYLETHQVDWMDWEDAGR